MRAVCGHTFPHQVLAERVDFVDLRTREAQGASALGQQQCGLRVIRRLTARVFVFHSEDNWTKAEFRTQSCNIIYVLK